MGWAGTGELRVRMLDPRDTPISNLVTPSCCSAFSSEEPEAEVPDHKSWELENHFEALQDFWLERHMLECL